MIEACQYLGGISRQTMYRLMGAGSLAAYHIGVRVYFTKESLDEFINGRVGLDSEVEEITPPDDGMQAHIKSARAKMLGGRNGDQRP